jgi:GTPase involved in cell partitioning and DNA repair
LKNDYLYNIAVKDVCGDSKKLDKYLKDIVKKAQAFIANKEEISDRDELKYSLNMIVSTVGNFVCLLSGKSTGKSSMIRHFEENNRTVFVVDLRKHGGDILKGLLQVLKER